jgi:hypothetical protein
VRLGVDEDGGQLSHCAPTGKKILSKDAFPSEDCRQLSLSLRENNEVYLQGFNN